MSSIYVLELLIRKTLVTNEMQLYFIIRYIVLTPDLFLRYVVWIKTICCCIADACACRTLTAMARVPVRARDQGMIVAKDSE